jgi:RNA polymerase-binding transcription factor DksA
MKKELDEQLVKDCPRFFRQRHWPMDRTCMCWGFPGDGWEPIIRKVAEAAEKLNNATEDPDMWIIAVQVKEKFGGLRYYVQNAPDEIDDMISEAENASYTICETCGKPGEPRKGGWLKTLCDDCHAERNKDRE